MKAYYKDGNYHLHIDEAKEFSSLDKGLETNLQKDFEGTDLGKKVTLSYDAKAEEHSIDFLPLEANWNKVNEIRVVLTNEEYQDLKKNRSKIIRFGCGFSMSSINLYLEQESDSLV